MNPCRMFFGTGATVRGLDEKTPEPTAKTPSARGEVLDTQDLPDTEVFEPVWLREETIESVRANKYNVKRWVVNDWRHYW